MERTLKTKPTIDLCSAEGNYHYPEGGEKPSEGCRNTVQDHGVRVNVWCDPYSDFYTNEFDINTDAQFDPE